MSNKIDRISKVNKYLNNNIIKLKKIMLKYNSLNGLANEKVWIIVVAFNKIK